MAKAIMIQGTTSNAGKSLLTAGLCRIFHQDGLRVAPFKSQNMALNSFVTPDGLEMGRAQVMQAECAGLPPDVRMNPILLKPNSDTGSQVIVRGEVLGNMRASEYFAYKHKLIPSILEDYHSLAAENDIIVLEGAGSPAEINLKQQDIVNMGMAKMAGAPVLLVGDINPGGMFASIAGTVQLLEPHEREMLKGVVINKFRGDLEILKPGLAQLEQIIHRPVLGVVPWMEIDVDDEDSMSDRIAPTYRAGPVDIAVIRLPRMSNFTDFASFEMLGVKVRYIGSPTQFDNPDMVILPGTKNTMGDLEWLRQSGMEAKVHQYASQGGAVFGICGGYQMLGTVLHDPENVEHGGTMSGLGLLEHETIFSQQKERAQVQGTFGHLEGVLSCLSGLPFTGYEIHMGTSKTAVEERALCRVKNAGGLHPEGINLGNVYGCYVHGIFDAPQIASLVVRALLKAKGLEASSVAEVDTIGYKQQQYDRLAKYIRNALDLEKIYAIIDKGV